MVGRRLGREEVGGNHRGSLSLSLSSFVGRAIDQAGLDFGVLPHPPRHRITGVWFIGGGFSETAQGPVKKGKTGVRDENSCGLRWRRMHMED